MRTVAGLVVIGLVGCSSQHAAVDSGTDARNADADIGDDAAPDALFDASIDAPSFVASPACTTTPSIMFDSMTRQIGNIARSGNTLYVSAYAVVNSTATDPVIIPIDLTTGTAGTAFIPDHPVALWVGGGDVYASERADDGTIWRLHDGGSPVALVQHLPTPTVVTSDDAYVYWGEVSGLVKRRALAGGAITPVTTCDPSRELVIRGDQLYCAYNGFVFRTAKEGAGQPIYMSSTATQYPIAEMIQDGSIYYITLDPMPDIFTVDTTTDAAVRLNQLTSIGRYYGIATSSDYFYISEGSGLRRMSRSTFASTVIAPATGAQANPIVWNGQLYFAMMNQQDPGLHYVMHCID
jgi:hypothetical protein